ncbi:MAG TPA: GntR family transcriptional regulator [Cellulomonas sp.]|nr:GntR family transcriptional regulator [Cellulomonas sp.]
MNALVRIDLSSATPQYEQVRAQIAALVTAGALSDGDRLPTVRALANDLGIAPGTIARAYTELEAAGLVASRRRVGTVVTAQRIASGEPAVAAARLAEVARAHGLTDSEAHDLLAAALIRDGAPSAAR